MADWELSKQAKICLGTIQTQIEKNTPEIANIASRTLGETIADRPLTDYPPLSERAKRELRDTIKTLLMKNVKESDNTDNSLNPIGVAIQATVDTALGKWLSDGLQRGYDKCIAGFPNIEFPGIKPKTPDKTSAR